jgi:hypothetical protein
LTVYKDQDSGNLLVYTVTGSITDNGAWDSFAISNIVSGGSFANNDIVKVFFSRTGDLGATGATGATGANGHDALVETTPESPGVNCATGGTLVTSGVDDGSGGGTADDGILQSGEIIDSQYVCNGDQGPTGADGINGTNGVDGYDAIINTTVEDPGTNCTNGGTHIFGGDDDGEPTGIPGDEILQPGEVDVEYFACNGGPIVLSLSGVSGIPTSIMILLSAIAFFVIMAEARNDALYWFIATILSVYLLINSHNTLIPVGVYVGWIFITLYQAVSLLMTKRAQNLSNTVEE